MNKFKQFNISKPTSFKFFLLAGIFLAIFIYLIYILFFIFVYGVIIGSVLYCIMRIKKHYSHRNSNKPITIDHDKIK